MGIDEENCNKILEMFNKSIEEKDREIADIKLNYEIENVLNIVLKQIRLLRPY